MANEVENVFLVNAPAGSGKTTKIKEMIIDHTIHHPDDNILCITYTNRAADELKKGLDTNKIHISTIHSFLNGFISIYFSLKQILDLYFVLYGEKICQRITNESGDSKIAASNEKYLTKFGSLNYETIKENIKALSYNEAQYSALYYGGLSHDDLITFSEEVFKRFPVIRKRLAQKYQIIFIDEYQDSSASVLRIFYEAIRGTSSKLYFLGDKMQQIYKNYDGSFESKFPYLNHTISLSTNHRSIPIIVDILNNIYNDPAYKQQPSPSNTAIEPDHHPRVIICSNMNERLEFEKKIYKNALLLFLPNQKKFNTIGAGDLYRQVKRMEKYSFVTQTDAVDVLTDDTSENTDALFKLLFLINRISGYYASNNLGSIVQLFKANSKIFDKEIYSISSHTDKARLKGLLDIIIKVYSESDQSSDIESVLNALMQTDLVKNDYINAIKDDEEYSLVLKVGINEFRAIADFLEMQNVSTQHGVKGESHDTVFFIAEDSTNTPVVHIYRFFELWSSIDFSLGELEQFYYEYMEWINEVVHTLGFKLSSINKELHDQNIKYLIEKSKVLLDHFKDHEIFNRLCSQPYHDYLAKPNVTKAKACFKESIPYGTLSAYRLFYVGCSRARRNISIFIDKAKITSYEDQFIEKLKRTGFVIE
jgi:DNA helicase-2/ATP-dependent DNA helicase PcrA